MSIYDPTSSCTPTRTTQPLVKEKVRPFAFSTTAEGQPGGEGIWCFPQGGGDLQGGRMLPSGEGGRAVWDPASTRSLISSPLRPSCPGVIGVIG